MRKKTGLRLGDCQGPYLDIASLHFALLVREHGSFRAAADYLGVQASVVSRKLQALEDVLGVSLFQRQTRGAQPTRAGNLVLDRARTILDDLRQLERTAAGHGQASSGALCFGVVSSIIGGRTRSLISQFIDENPTIAFEVSEDFPRDHLAAIRALRMDAAMIPSGAQTAELEVMALWTDPILLAVPVDHFLARESSISWKQLETQTFVVSRGFPGPEIRDHLVRKLSKLGLHPRIEAHGVDREGLLALVAMGVGLTLVALSESAIVDAGVVYRPLEGEFLSFSLVWSPENDNPALRRFLVLSRGMQQNGSETPAGH